MKKFEKEFDPQAEILGAIRENACCLEAEGAYAKIAESIAGHGSLRYMALREDKEQSVADLVEIIKDARSSCSQVCSYTNDSQKFYVDVLAGMLKDPKHKWEGAQNEIAEFLGEVRRALEKE